MKIERNKLVLSTFLFFLCLITWSQNIQKIDSLFTEMYTEKAFNGNVLVSKAGSVLFEKSYGYANIEEKTPLNTNAIFNLASITKQFTAAAIVLLSREDKLSLNDDIRFYIPELDFYPEISILNLLRHTSGLIDHMAFTDSVALQTDSTCLLDNDKVIELFQKHQPALNFEPDTKFEYSNTGYVLLATIIERITYKSFGGYLQEAIFDPLEMHSTKVLYRYAEGVTVENLTHGYQESEEGELLDALLSAPAVRNYDLVKGPGRLFSSTIDLNIWSNALTNNFFSKSELDLICKAGETTNDGKYNYGLGWFVTEDILNGKSIYHSGSWPGYVTYIEKNLEKDLTLIILQNMSTNKSYLPTFLLRKYLYENETVNVSADYLNSLAGSYENSTGRIKEIVYEDEKLYVQVNPSFKLEILPRTKAIFKVAGFDPEVNFEFLFENGEVVGYNFYQLNRGITDTAAKIK